MTAQQKIELKRSEIRQRLGAIAELQGDDVTDDITTERDGLMGELRNSEGQLQAAIEAEATETRGASAVERLDDGESVEYRGLVERSKLSAYVLESHRQGGLDGAESELRAAVFGDRARPGLVPWEVASAEEQDRQSIRGKGGRQHEHHGQRWRDARDDPGKDLCRHGCGVPGRSDGVRGAWYFCASCDNGRRDCRSNREGRPRRKPRPRRSTSQRSSPGDWRPDTASLKRT